MKRKKIVSCLLVSILISLYIYGCERNDYMSIQGTATEVGIPDNSLKIAGRPSNMIVENNNYVGSVTTETTTETETTSADTASETTPAETTTTTSVETTNKPEDPITPATEASMGYTYTELSQTMYAKSSVNVRKGPEVSFEKLGGLSKAEAVEVTGQCNETGWYRIKFKGKEGFVSESYLVLEKPKTIAANPEITTTPDTEIEKRSYMLNVPCILQNPELPTGCEIPSLTIVLNYLGITADKCDLADNYLEKGEIGSTLPYVAFVGEPRDPKSFGCYAPVIVKTANRYLELMGSDLTAVDLSGSSFESLFAEIEAGNPIVIWATLNMDEPYYSVTWNVNGEKFTWKRREHCLVLTGYDVDAGLVYVADPMKGNVTYDMKVFKDRYEQLYSQAVVIR